MRVFIGILTLIFSGYAFALENKLKNHASPYLAMHGNDPVEWQEWNKKTVARSKREGKLLFVSSGYFSCHWCHVMQRESYQNSEAAKLLNAHFIPVKVDREINSALDARLIDFVERTQGRAGWPLNVFITPDGYPLVGMTYVPTKNFIDILNNITAKWGKERLELEKIAKQATDELSTVAIESSDNIDSGLSDDYLYRFLSQAITMSDDMAGGFGDQNKFPSFPQLNMMLQACKNKPDKNKPNNNIKQFLVLTLDKMASQGLNDQLDGGFFRYVVDPTWQVPHFEKMLYDNALLASLYLDAGKILNDDKYTDVAKQTLDFMLSVFRSSQGAYIASLSAIDNKGVEGGYYLWQVDELKKIVTKDEMQVIELIWQLEGVDDLDGGHHLVEVMDINSAAQMLNLSVEKTKIYFESAKKKMLNVRKQRSVPRDDKLLAAWNALALSAFSKAAKQLNISRYADAAKKIKDYIFYNLWKNNALLRAVKNRKTLGAGGLEDYAYLAQGLYDWVGYSENKQDVEWLEEVVEQSWKRFHGVKGWLLAENMLLKYGQGESVLSDGVLPSASATLVNVSLKIAEKNNNSILKNKALKALNAGHLEVVSQPFWYATHILALYEHQK